MFKLKLFFFIQSALRYFPFSIGILLRRLLYKPFFRSAGSNLVIYEGVIIKYPNEISLGKNITINQFCYISGKGGLTIGDDVMIASGCKIVTSSHGYQNIEIPMAKQKITFKPIFIGNDVWFGFNVVVLGGSHIKKGSILGTAAFVNGKSYPQYAIIGGIPSKLIKIRSNACFSYTQKQISDFMSSQPDGDELKSEHQNKD